MNNQNQLVEKSSQAMTALAIVLAMAMPTLAFAADQPDVSAVVTYIGYAVAALIAIGVAKLIPAAVMWLYSSLTTMIKRG